MGWAPHGSGAHTRELVEERATWHAPCIYGGMTNAIALALTVYCSLSSRRTQRTRALLRVSGACVVVAAANVAASLYHADTTMLWVSTLLVAASSALDARLAEVRP